jgi:hypothetical protein
MALGVDGVAAGVVEIYREKGQRTLPSLRSTPRFGSRSASMICA